MKEIQIKTFDNEELDLVKKMRILGMSRKTASLFLFLAKNKDKSYSSKEIEIATGLRQPEVSLGRKKFLNYLEISKVTSEKGRPRNQYKLNTDIEIILTNVFTDLHNDYQKKLDILQELEHNIMDA